MSAALQHVPVLLKETIEALHVQASGVYVDATFGRGGHSLSLLKRLGPDGQLIAFDRDPEAIAQGKGIVDSRFTIVHCAFSQIGEMLMMRGISKVNGVMLDIGVSSPQIDEASRGFSFRFDAPLDMRMDQSSGQTAQDFLATASEQQLKEVIKYYGEERYAKQIARAIVAARTSQQFPTTTRQLAALVANTVPKTEFGQDPATRTFQAIRIFINQELEELSLTLPQCADLLMPGGRLAVISFHSLEDRIVKRFIRDQQNRDRFPVNVPLRAADLPPSRMIAVGKAIRASAAEIKSNPRARSAVLRVAERTTSA